MTAPRWDRVLVHHSAGQDHDRRDLDAIRAFHTAPPPAGRGWSDIGYHWVCERVGQRYAVFPGRPMTRPGAHCPGLNATALGVCFVGDFTLVGPTDDQLDVGARLVAYLCREFHIPPERVEPHRAHRATECPGLRFPMAALLDRVRRELAAMEA